MGLLLASLEEERRQERGRFLSKLGEVLIEVLCSQNPYLGCCRMFCIVVQSVGFANLLRTLVLEEEMKKIALY